MNSPICKKWAVLILTCNGLDNTKKCLYSLKKHSCDYSVYILDNGSRDETVKWLQENKEELNITFIYSSHENLGLPYGRNYLIKSLFNEPYVVFIDNDIEFTEPWQDQTEYCLNCEQIGLVGHNGAYYVRTGEKLDPVVLIELLNKHSVFWQKDKFWQIDAVYGYFMAIKKENLNHAKFDTNLPFWYEDNDFCFQIRYNLNMEVVALPFLNIIHYGHVSSVSVNIIHSPSTAMYRQAWDYMIRKWKFAFRYMMSQNPTETNYFKFFQ